MKILLTGCGVDMTGNGNNENNGKDKTIYAIKIESGGKIKYEMLNLTGYNNLLKKGCSVQVIAESTHDDKGLFNKTGNVNATRHAINSTMLFDEELD